RENAIGKAANVLIDSAPASWSAPPQGSCFSTAALPIHADSIKTGAAPVDTEHLFGFVEGADIGNCGEREFVLDSSSRAGRASGSFAVTTSELEFKCVPKLADFGRHGPWLLRPRQHCGHRGCPARRRSNDILRRAVAGHGSCTGPVQPDLERVAALGFRGRNERRANRSLRYRSRAARRPRAQT